MADSLADLNQSLRQFAIERDWLQFQTPKNLSMALIGEAAELVEHFQWLTAEQSENLSPEKTQEVGYEMADVLIYLLRMADQLDIDVVAMANEKTRLNQKRYPKDKVRGDARRASEYLDEED